HGTPHGGVAVEEQVALLSGGASLIVTSGDEAVGFLGLSPRAPARADAHAPVERWVDVTLVAVSADQPIAPIMRQLLTGAATFMRESPITGLVCLAAQDWLIDALAEGGFREVDRVLSYARANQGPLPAPPHVSDLRAAQAAQAGSILELNAAAFGPFWSYDQRTMLSWLMTADHAVVAERSGRVLGFALTTLNAADSHAQLIRVATHPTSQGQGIGRQLVADAIRFAAEVGAAGVSLNTQASNIVSRHLYETLGFRPTGGVLSVMARAGPA
ncbi:MAG: [ribosomal protein S18]-alanine N-acetyltransferase, partial [Chloroflexota bacterium]|nr:[ribosomal protein S18]-alanine N-acetyltransferase [Chloroflexota bacterium]